MIRMPDRTSQARRARRQGRWVRGALALLLAGASTVWAEGVLSPRQEMIAAAEEVAEVDPALTRTLGGRLQDLPAHGDQRQTFRDAAREAIQIEIDRELDLTRREVAPVQQPGGARDVRGASDKARGEAMRAQGAARGSSVVKERGMKMGKPDEPAGRGRELTGGAR